MFYAHFVLSKKGPLARIWLAAHWDKKLTRAHVFETNISSSVEAILEPKLKMALRTSGHLLLGVVRIYSRKAKYLLADCNEAFVKIKMAFRPGVVDLPDDVNREAAISAITLPENLPDFEATIADLNEINMNAITINQSRPEDITMREDFGEINLGRQDDDFGDSAFEESVSREVIREGDKTFGDGIYPVAGGLSIRSGGEDFSLQHDGTLIGGRSDDSRKHDKDGGLSARPDDIGIDDNDFGDGFLGAPDDDDENFGGEIDHSLFADAGIFEDPSAQKQLEHLTSEIASHMDTANLGLSLGTGELEAPGTVGTGRSVESGMHVDGKSPEPFANTAVEATLDTGLSSNTFLTSVAATGAAGQGALVTGATAMQDTQSTTLLTNESEAFALPPIDTTFVAGMEPKRATKRKRRLIIDEQKSIPSEIMKLQMDDTSDITTQLDLAPPTKKLMHWKETGSVDKLFTLPGRTIPSRILQRLFMRNLQTMPVPDDALEAQHPSLSTLKVGPAVRTAKRSEPAVQEGAPADDAATTDSQHKNTPLAFGTDPPGQDLLASHSPSLTQPVKIVPQSANAKLDVISEEVAEELSAKNTHSDIDQAPLDDDDDDFGCHHMDNDLAFMGEPETPYIAPPSVLSEAPHSVMQADMFALEQELAAADDEAENELAAAFHAAAAANAGAVCGDGMAISGTDGAMVGPGGVSVMESLEERKLEKRSKVLLRMLGAHQRQHGWNEPLSLHNICSGNTKKQAASKFYTILLLRKQGAVDLYQADAYSDILVSRGANFSRLVEV